jgi:hypothetical protein
MRNHAFARSGKGRAAKDRLLVEADAVGKKQW